jgi:hypothetical protein
LLELKLKQQQFLPDAVSIVKLPLSQVAELGEDKGKA